MSGSPHNGDRGVGLLPGGRRRAIEQRSSTRTVRHGHVSLIFIRLLARSVKWRTSRVSLRTELLQLHRSLKFTALHITHDQEEALEMGDRVVLMRDGHIEQVGPPSEVYQAPVSPYAAHFLGVRNELLVRRAAGGLQYAGKQIKGHARWVHA